MTTTPMNHLIKRSGSLAGRPPKLGSATSKVWGKPQYMRCNPSGASTIGQKDMPDREDSRTEYAQA
jgi:hypothetical protein